MVTRKEPTHEVKKNQLLGLLHLQSTPRKAEVVTWGYDLGTWYGRRDNCATALLALLLFVTALTVTNIQALSLACLFCLWGAGVVFRVFVGGVAWP